MVYGIRRDAQIARAADHGAGNGGNSRLARPLVPGIPSRVVDPSGVVKHQERGVRTARGPGSDAEGATGGRLVVGSGLGFSGQITACDTLVVHGEVGAELPGRVIEVGPSGVFRGVAEVDEAFIAGHFDGTLTVRRCLTVAAGGRLSGTVRYAELSVESGGRISGDLREIGEEAASAAETVETVPTPEEPEIIEAPSSATEEDAETSDDDTKKPGSDPAKRRFQQKTRAKRQRELAESDA